MIRSTPQFDVEVIYEKTIDVAAERERLSKELAKLEKGVTSAERQLSNPAFLEKGSAPRGRRPEKNRKPTRASSSKKPARPSDDLTQEGPG